jgi:hypothetical protein
VGYFNQLFFVANSNKAEQMALLGKFENTVVPFTLKGNY